MVKSKELDDLLTQFTSMTVNVKNFDNSLIASVSKTKDFQTSLEANTNSMTNNVKSFDQSLNSSVAKAKEFQSSLQTNAKSTASVAVNQSSLMSSTNKTTTVLSNLNSATTNTATAFQNQTNAANAAATTTAQSAGFFDSIMQGIGSAVGYLKDTLWSILGFGAKVVTTGVATVALAGILAGVVTSFITGLVSKVFGAIQDSFEKMSSLQTKGLATNITLDEIIPKEFFETNKTRSRLSDVQGELLTFRELGIKKFDDSTIKLADKMIFTGQKVGTLAKFLTDTALAVNLNTSQAEKLAAQMAQTTDSYQISQEAIFDAVASMGDVLNKVTGLFGSGKELTSLVSLFTQQFGRQYSGDIKNVLSYLFSQQGQIFLRSTPEAMAKGNKLLQGTATIEDMKAIVALMDKAVTRLAPDTQQLESYYVQEARLSVLNMDTAVLVSARNLAAAEKLEQLSESAYRTTVTGQDAINAVKTASDQLALDALVAFKESIGGASNDVNRFRKAIDQFLMDTRQILVGNILPTITEFINSNFAGVVSEEKLKEFMDKLNEPNIIRASQEQLRPTKQVVKLDDDIYRARNQQLQNLSPEISAEGKGLLAEMSTSLRGLKQNSDDQMKMLKYPNRFMESPAMNRSV